MGQKLAKSSTWADDYKDRSMWVCHVEALRGQFQKGGSQATYDTYGSGSLEDPTLISLIKLKIIATYATYNLKIESGDQKSGFDARQSIL